jgi:hypothetical protein
MTFAFCWYSCGRQNEATSIHEFPIVLLKDRDLGYVNDTAHCKENKAAVLLKTHSNGAKGTYLGLLQRVLHQVDAPLECELCVRQESLAQRRRHAAHALEEREQVLRQVLEVTLETGMGNEHHYAGSMLDWIDTGQMN